MPGAAWAEGMPQLDFTIAADHRPGRTGAPASSSCSTSCCRASGLPKVGAVIEQRAVHIAADLDAAKAQKAQADAAVAELTATIQRSRAAAQGEINQAVDQAKAAAAAQATALNARLEAQLKAAEARIDAARAAALGALHEVATDTANTVIARLTGAAPDPRRVDTAVAAALTARARGLSGGAKRDAGGRASSPSRATGWRRRSSSSSLLFGRKLWGAIAAMLDDRAGKDPRRAGGGGPAAHRGRGHAEGRAGPPRRCDGRGEAVAGRRQGMKPRGSPQAAADEAEAAARRREQMALDRIAAAEKAAVDEVRTTAAEVATVAARHVIADELSADADGRLIDQAITQLPSALSQRRVA